MIVIIIMIRIIIVQWDTTIQHTECIPIGTIKLRDNMIMILILSILMMSMVTITVLLMIVIIGMIQIIIVKQDIMTFQRASIGTMIKFLK